MPASPRSRSTSPGRRLNADRGDDSAVGTKGPWDPLLEICEYCNPELSLHFGSKLLVMLFFLQHLLKGFARDLNDKAKPYLLLTLPAPQAETFQGIAELPWSMKPFVGLLSDALPIMGYSKGPYILGATALGVFGALTIGLAPGALSVSGTIICVFLLELQFSTCDLLSEATYASKIRQSAPSKGPELLSFVWFGIQLASFLGILSSGPLLKVMGTRPIFLLMLVPCALAAVPVLRGYLEEPKKGAVEVIAARRRLQNHPELCGLCLLMTACSLFLFWAGLRFESPVSSSLAGVVVLVVMVTAFWLFLTPTIAAYATFSLVQSSLHISVESAAFYFYTDTPAEYPEGPHFSTVFYNSVLGSMAALCSMVGIVTYQRYLKTWSYRRLILATNLFSSLLGFLDVIIFARLNLFLGIPDQYYLLGAAVFTKVVQEWNTMPSVVIISQLCPSGVEATMYALLASTVNLGSPIADSFGGLLLELLNCRPTEGHGEGRQFENLWLAAFITALLPGVTILALFLLVPDRRQDERVMENPDFDGTEGSVFRRWKERRSAEWAP